MQLFRLDKEYQIGCESESTRYGFRHIATLFRHGIEIEKAIVRYYNRTWERYTFETVMLKCVEKFFSDGEEVIKYRNIVKKGGEVR